MKKGAKRRGAGPRDAFAGTGVKELSLVDNQIVIEKSDGQQVPLMHNQALAIEITDEARCQIARKIARLLPDLAHAKKIELLEYTERVLQALCKDQLVRVRRILAQELKDYPDAPHELISTLAWDESLEVSAPVLECSPVLTDHDLVAIIKGTGIPGVTEAVAKRSRLTSLVSDAIVRSGHRGAITTMLDNEGAEISAKSYDRLMLDAPDVEMWHEPLVQRPDLPGTTMNKLAGFVSESLVVRMRDQGRISKKTAKSLLHEIHERLKSPTLDRTKSAAEYADELHALGELTAEAVDDAVCRKDKAFVIRALHLLSGLSEGKITRMLDTDNPKAITALCWKAELPMRVSYQIQLRMARIHHTKTLRPKGGNDYPLRPEELEVYLDLFGD